MDTCVWEGNYNEYETVWEGSCGAEFILLEGTPAENGMKYCPNCGRKLTQRAPDWLPVTPKQVDEDLDVLQNFMSGE